MSEIEHDANRWGVPYTDEATPRELTRLADLVKQEMSLDPTKALGDAVNSVINALCREPKIDVFLLRTARKARPLLDTDWWITPLRSRGAWILRGGALDYSNSWQVAPATSSLLADEPLDERKQGRAGLIYCLRECWYGMARQVADLDQDLASRVAVLSVDAHLLTSAVRGVHAASVSTVGQRKLPSDSEVADEHRKLGGKKGKATSALMLKYSVSRSTIQKAVARAKPSGGLTNSVSALAAQPKVPCTTSS
jgi:hypothetical protein